MKELEVLKDAIETLEKCEAVGTFAIALENVSLGFKELEATLSPRPIEEAPDNGENLLADTYERGPVVVFWNGNWWESDGGFYASDEIKSWLPLPSMDGGEK